MEETRSAQLPTSEMGPHGWLPHNSSSFRNKSCKNRKDLDMHPGQGMGTLAGIFVHISFLGFKPLGPQGG